MRVFVAGATGAIGKQLVPRLVAAGHEVHGMTRSESKQAMLSESELRKRQEELMRGQAELEQLSYDLQQEVAQKEELLTEKIYNNVAAIVRQVALEEKLQVVLVRSEMTVLYVDPRLDLTNKIIVRYDKEHTK